MKEKYQKVYLPQYSLKLTLVELMFGVIKRKIKWKIMLKWCNFSILEGEDAIVEASVI